MIRFFSDIKPLNIPVLALLFIAIRITSIQITGTEFLPSTEPYSVLNFFFDYINTFTRLSAIISAILTFITALHLNHLFNYNQIGENKNFLTAYFYCITVAFFPEFNLLQPALVVNLMASMAFFRIFELYKAEQVTDNLFFSGLLTGVCLLFHLEYALLFLLIIAGIALFRNLKLRDIGVSFLGFLLPPFLTIVLSYLLQDQLLPLPLHLAQDFSTTLTPDLSISNILIPSILGILFITSSIHVLTRFWRNSIKNRRIILLMYLYLALSVFIILVGTPINLTNGALILPPMAVLMALYFNTYIDIKQPKGVRIFKKILHNLVWITYFGLIALKSLA